MFEFLPEENTAICMYGPPEYFSDDETAIDYTPVETEDETFFGKIVAALRKLIDFIKGLFNR